MDSLETYFAILITTGVVNNKLFKFVTSLLDDITNNSHQNVIHNMVCYFSTIIIRNLYEGLRMSPM